MKKLALFLIVVMCVCAMSMSAFGGSVVVVQDDFEDGVLETSKWKSINGPVTESGGSVVFGSQFVVTQDQWQRTAQTPIVVTG